MRLTTVNLRLQSGRYSTEEDMQHEYRRVTNLDFDA